MTNDNRAPDRNSPEYEQYRAKHYAEARPKKMKAIADLRKLVEKGKRRR